MLLLSLSITDQFREQVLNLPMSDLRNFWNFQIISAFGEFSEKKDSSTIVGTDCSSQSPLSGFATTIQTRNPVCDVISFQAK